MRKILIFLGLLFIAASLTTPAKAAWSDAKKLSSGTGHTIMPSITTDANGYLHAVWMELTPGSEDFWTGVENPGIYYSKWNGDMWSTPLKISQNTGKWAGLPSIASDSLNRLHVVWDEHSYDVNGNEEGQIKYSMYDGVSWSTPTTISTATNGSNKWNRSARVAVDSSNVIHVIYNFSDYNLSWYNEFYYTKKNGSWSTAEKISENFVNVQHASLATGPTTTVNVALWTETGIWFKKNDGSGWTAAVQVRDVVYGDSARYPQYPKLVVDGSGKRHLMWAEIENIAGAEGHKAQYSSSTDGITWAAPTTLNTNNMEWTYWGIPLIGLTKDSRNNIYAGWGELNAVSGIDIKYRKWNGASWASAVTIRNVAEVDSPYLYQDVWDNQHFIWTEKNQGNGLWEIWYSIAPATWSTIGSGGGSFTISTASRTFVDVTIPSGALSTNTSISAAIGPLPASANPSYVTIPRSYFFGPDGQSFLKAITTVYYYLDAEVLNGDPRNLGVYVWDGQTESWSYQTGTVNTSQKKVTIKPTHFSLYGVMSPKVNLVFNTPTGDVSGGVIPVSFDMTYAKDGSAVPATVRQCTSPEDTGCLEDTQAGANVALLLKNSAGIVVRRVYSDGEGDGVFTVSGGNYSVNLASLGMSEGDYTLEVLLGRVALGTKSIHFSAGVPLRATFLRPLGTDEVYTMVDGSTLPIKFALYKESVLNLVMQNVTVKVDGLTNLFVLGDGARNIRFDPGNGQYILNLSTKDLGLPLGENIISVRVDGSEAGTAKFELLEGGKATGKNR